MPATPTAVPAAPPPPSAACALLLFASAVARLSPIPALAEEPAVSIVFPANGACVATERQTFVIGSVRPPDAPLTVNGQPVTPWRTGGFLHMLPVTPGTNTLVFRAGAVQHLHTFTVPAPAPAWDRSSLCALQPLRALGVLTGETLRLACRAPTGLVVRAAVGERTLALTPQPGDPTRYEADLRFSENAERVPIIYFSEPFADATSATVTARSVWPAHTVTGGAFEVRARAAPGEGDTVAFLPPGLSLLGAGFEGAYTRIWLAGTPRYVETRHLTAAADTQRPPRDVPAPDLGAGYGPHPPAHAIPGGPLIVLDPGHGGDSTGAVGPTGTPEKEVTLEQARAAKSLLEQAGFRVRLTREADGDVGLYDRVRFAYAERAHAFISIHYNSCAPSSNPREVRHIATYAWNAIGEQLARALHPRLAEVTAIPDNGVRAASFAVCRNPAIPSVLLELDFITAPEGEESIRRPEQQRRVAEAILAGLRDWLGPEAARALSPASRTPTASAERR